MMDGNGQQRQEGHRRQMMEQQHQGGWYASQNTYQQHQPQEAFKWPGYHSPATGQYFAQPPPAQSFGRPDYYIQRPCVLSLPQQPQVQHHANVHTQQEQVWPSTNGWNQSRWNHQGTSTVSEEEDWAAKARAWAAAKASQETAQQAQVEADVSSQTSILQQEQLYQEYQQVAQAVKHPSETAHPPSLIPPGQEPAHYRQDLCAYPRDPLTAFLHEEVPPSFGHDGASSAYAQAAAHAQVVSSSYSQDMSSSYGQDTATAAPPGMEQQEQLNRKPSHPYVAPDLPPPPPLQLPVQVSPPTQSQQFPFQEPALPPAFEFLQQFDYQKPPPQEYQSATQYLPSIPSMGMDAPEMNFGGPANVMSVWPSLGSQGMTFPSSMGPGGSGSHLGPQFDHPHHNHHHSHSMQSHQPPHMFPRPHGPGFHPTGPGLGGSFGFGGSHLGQGPDAVTHVFLPDGNGNLPPPDRPKKAPVPLWLRDELLKKRAAVSTSSLAVISLPDDFVQMDGSDATTAAGVFERSRSDSSGISDNDEDDEDDIRAARIAAMNQEIKRVLTEILLMVTDDLFDELAQEVMDENEIVEVVLSDAASPFFGLKLLAGQGKASISAETLEGGEKWLSVSPQSPPGAPDLLETGVVVAPVERNSASSEDGSDSICSVPPVGNVLGLATYASDDEDPEQGERRVWVSIDPEANAERKQSRDKAKNTGNLIGDMTVVNENIGVREGRHEQDRNALPLKEEEMRNDTREKQLKDGIDNKNLRERVRDREGRGQENILETERKKTDKRPDLKVRKHPHENSNNGDQDQGTKRRRKGLDVDVQMGTTDADLGFRERVDLEVSGNYRKPEISHQHPANLIDESQSIPGAQSIQETFEGAQSEVLTSGVAVTSSAVFAGRKRKKIDVMHERHSEESTVQSNDGSGVLLSTVCTRWMGGTDTVIKKRRNNEDVSMDHDFIKHHNYDTKKDADHKLSSKEKENSWVKELDEEGERSHEKVKATDPGWGADVERTRREMGKDHDRVRSKSGKDQSGRIQEKHKDHIKRSRHRSSSASSRSPCSRTHGSGSDRSRSPRQRKQLGRSSRRPSVSRSPVRSKNRDVGLMERHLNNSS